MKNCFNRISRRAAYRETGISVDSVRQRVAQKLGDAPEERERTKRRMKKRLVLSVVVAILLFATAAAATSGHLSFFFPNGISAFEKNVSTEHIECIFGGEWKTVVTQTLSDENSTYIELKTTGVTDEAKAFLADFDNLPRKETCWFPIFDYYMDGDYMPSEYLGNETTEFHCGSNKEPEAEEDYLYTWVQITCPLSERKPISIELMDRITHDSYPERLTIPIKNSIGDKLVLTPNQKIKNYDDSAVITHSSDIKDIANPTTNTIKGIQDIEKEILIKKLTMTPLGLQIEYADASNLENAPIPEGCIFFEMADGKIYSIRHMLNTLSYEPNAKDLSSLTATGNIREVKELNAYKSIIIGTTAYPLDGGKSYQVKIDPHLKPFTMPVRKKMVTEVNDLGESYQREDDWYSVKELCAKLGAGYTWDSAKNTASITYCGETLTLPLGETEFHTPGDPRPDIVKAELENDTLYANRNLLFALRLTDGTTQDSDVKIIFP